MAMLRMLPPDSSKASGAEVEVEVLGTRHARGQASVPERPPQTHVRRRKVDDHVEAAGEGLVDVGPQVGGQDGEAVEGLHPLQQVGDLDVGVAVVGVAHLGPLAEEGIGLVEEQDGVDAVGLGEDPLQVLLGLTHVLVDHGGQVDGVQVEAEVAGHDLGRHGLAGARSRPRTAP